ncbi:cupredoxin domain-containing protein [Candidatus Parcubacteria bacterium]|jgi:Cu+-exporting ATPase|nr:MAG: cupredoxin domain-containing protein [Candidatus Parcubacteria bacterium]
MQIFGILLIFLVIVLFWLWLKFQLRQEKAVASAGSQSATILIKGAYNPKIIKASINLPLRLTFDRQEDAECSRFVTFAELKLRKDLPAFKKTEITFTPRAKGEINFSCDMGMYQGKIIVE